jgi:diaminopimelate decarboxylase
MLLPFTTGINDDGIITIGGCDVASLKAKYGTPLYIIDLDTLQKQCENYLSSFNFAGYETEIIYASKAFCALPMCQYIKQQGLSIDVSTGGELYTVLKSGFKPEKIFFHGNNKSLEEIKFGLEYKVGTFVVDNINEMETINFLAGERAIKQDIMLRITPGIKAHTHKYIQTGAIESKFGFGLYEGIAMGAVNKALNMENLNLTGFHAHIGSQIFNIEVYDKLIGTMLGFIREIKDTTGFEAKTLNIGGGLGIRYVPQDQPSSIEEFAAVVGGALEKYSAAHGVKITKICLEPGRSIIGNAGTTLYEVGVVKVIPRIKNYIAVDGGMSDNIRPVLYQAKYQAYIANRAAYAGKITNGDSENTGSESKNSPSGKSETVKYTIVGKHCESGDVIIEDIMLPAVKERDLILVGSTGAYCYSMSSNYNGQPRSAVITVKDGKSCTWVERQSYEDLILKDKKLNECE